MSNAGTSSFTALWTSSINVWLSCPSSWCWSAWRRSSALVRSPPVCTTPTTPTTTASSSWSSSDMSKVSFSGFHSNLWFMCVWYDRTGGLFIQITVTGVAQNVSVFKSCFSVLTTTKMLFYFITEWEMKNRFIMTTNNTVPEGEWWRLLVSNVCRVTDLVTYSPDLGTFSDFIF